LVRASPWRGVSGPESRGSDGMEAQGYKAQKVMADSRPQPRGLNIDFTLGRRTGSVGVSLGYVSGRPRWAGNIRSQPSLRFPVIYEPIMAVAVPKCSVYALPTRRMRHPVVVLLSVWVSHLRVAALTIASLPLENLSPSSIAVAVEYSITSQ
jgi:hypothetical protein